MAPGGGDFRLKYCMHFPTSMHPIYLVRASRSLSVAVHTNTGLLADVEQVGGGGLGGMHALRSCRHHPDKHPPPSLLTCICKPTTRPDTDRPRTPR